MYTNGINNYNTVREDTSKQQMSNQNFDFDGEAFDKAYASLVKKFEPYELEQITVFTNEKQR